MKLSTRARYGTRALLDLALHSSNEPVQLKDIAHRQDISLHYLEHLITPLISAGILRSTRGARGGVQLARTPVEIKLSEIVQVLEGSITPVECVEKPEVCERTRSCAVRDVWCEMFEIMWTYLSKVTLQELVERQKNKEQTEKTMYYV